jgi:hypothetical protein
MATRIAAGADEIAPSLSATFCFAKLFTAGRDLRRKMWASRREPSIIEANAMPCDISLITTIAAAL